jgi:hypothetical protein
MMDARLQAGGTESDLQGLVSVSALLNDSPTFELTGVHYHVSFGGEATATVSGTAAGKDSKQTDVTITLIREGGVWKVDGFSMPQDQQMLNDAPTADAATTTATSITSAAPTGRADVLNGNFPSDIPYYTSNAKITSGRSTGQKGNVTDWDLTQSTTDSPTVVAQFFVDQFKALGWHMDNMAYGTGGIPEGFTASKGGREVRVSTSPWITQKNTLSIETRWSTVSQ